MTPAEGALIVLVDDEPSVARATQMLLELEGHVVLSAKSLGGARAAIEKYGQMPDLIVSDYHLGPDHSGIDVIRELRNFAGCTIPAILVTGDTSPRMADAELNANFDVFSKPVVAERFLACINRRLHENPPVAARSWGEEARLVKDD